MSGELVIAVAQAIHDCDHKCRAKRLRARLQGRPDIFAEREFEEYTLFAKAAIAAMVDLSPSMLAQTMRPSGYKITPVDRWLVEESLYRLDGWNHSPDELRQHIAAAFNLIRDYRTMLKFALRE